MTGPYGTETDQEQRGAVPAEPEPAVPRAGGGGASPTPGDAGPGWGPGGGEPTQALRALAEEPPRPAQPERPPQPERAPQRTVLPPGGAPRPAAARAVPPRAGRAEARAARTAPRARRARLTLKRIDPWSVFLFSLVASVFVAVALVVAVAVLYSVLGALGVTGSLNELFSEVTGSTDPLLSTARVVGGAAVLAAVNIVTLTLLATLGALLYNVCASFTGGLELTLGERD
jgi:hypothetical protein